MTFDIFGKRLEVSRKGIFLGAAVFVLVCVLGVYTYIKGNDDIIIEAGAKATEASTAGGQGAAGQGAVRGQGAGGQGAAGGQAVAGQGAAGGQAVAGGQGAAGGQAVAGADEIKVYVVGCVNRQGIVTLKKGQLIDDAIRLAGGATSDADLININLVYQLKENLMLYIRSKNETATVNGGSPDSGSPDGGEAGKGARIVRDSGGAVVNSPEESSGEGSKVNINTAGEGELDTLPGVGEATAKDIITYREKNGPFRTIQDIMKVPRIKESRFARIEEFITVD